MKLTSLYIVVLLLFFFASCANQSSPTGGPKDEDAPILVLSEPQDQQLNYTDKQIALEFDELIAVNNMNKQLIITPRTDIKYDVKYKKNRVILTFEAPLDSNTTYTFNFREGITDLNEKNFPPDLSVAFSTGAYLDSMMISGIITNLYTGSKKNDISIGLYDANDTMEVFKDPPLYLTKTNKNGKYSLSNIKKGTYKMIAFQDKNNNLTLQTSSESYGFSNELIQLDTLLTDYNLPLFNLNVDSLKLQSARPTGHYFVIKYNKPITEYSLSLLDSTLFIYSQLTGDDKEIKLYNSFESIDSLAIITIATDSVLQQVTDTVFLKFDDTKRDKDEYKTKATITGIDYNQPQLDIVINFNKPTFYKNTDSLFVFIDSLTQIDFDTADFTWNKTLLSLHITKTLQKEQFEPKATGDTTANGKEITTIIRPHLYMGKGTFHSIESDTSKSSTSKLKKVNNKDTGIIKVNITNTNAPFVLQLLDKKNNVLQEDLSIENINSLFIYNNLKAGEYRFRVLVDSNNSGTWDLGNILKNIPPEPIFFYESEEGNKDIMLRANWEIGPLNFTF